MPRIRDEPVAASALAMIAVSLLGRFGLHVGENGETIINLAAVACCAVAARAYTRPASRSIPVPSIVQGEHGPELITFPKPSVAAPSAQTIGATAMPDFGNWFDATFKTPLLTLEHDGEEWLTDDAKNLIGQAKADAQVAETAAVTAAASQAAALSAAVKPHLDSAVDAIADKVPLVGGLIKGEAEATANSASDAFFGALASWAQSMLAPKPAA